MTAISKLNRLLNADNNDLISIVDIDGGIAGKPKTKKITVSDLLKNIEVGNQLELPATIKNTASNNDYVFIIDANGVIYKITKSDFLAGLITNIPASEPPLQIQTISKPLSLTANGYQQLSLTLGNSYILTKVVCSVSNLRVRLHLSQTFADSDLSRAIGGTLPTSHGLIYDAVFNNNIVSLDVLPSAIASPNNESILTVNNLLSTAQSLTITFYYISLL